MMKMSQRKCCWPNRKQTKNPDTKKAHFTLKELSETFLDLESKKEKMLEADPNSERSMPFG